MKFWDILFPSQGARDSQAAVFHEYLPCSLFWDTCNGVPIYDLHLGNLWPHVGCTTYTGRARSENTGKYLVSYQIVYYKMDKWKAFGKLPRTSYNRENLIKTSDAEQLGKEKDKKFILHNIKIPQKKIKNKIIIDPAIPFLDIQLKDLKAET